MRLRPLAALAALILIAGCAVGGYRTTTKNGHEKVYRMDEGEKKLVYEVDPDGTLTVYDEADPRAQRMLEAEAQKEAMAAAEIARQERIATAPKRDDSDPIRVILHEIVLSEDLQSAQHTEGATDHQLRAQFDNDPILAMVPPSAAHGNELTQAFRMLAGQTPEPAAPSADVEVVTVARLEKKVGINKATNKVGEYVAVVFESTITSNYLPAEYTVTEEGNVFRNVEVTERLAEKVKGVIKEKIGPTIPADRDI
jgi:hypothetical protein